MNLAGLNQKILCFDYSLTKVILLTPFELSLLHYGFLWLCLQLKPVLSTIPMSTPVVHILGHLGIFSMPTMDSRTRFCQLGPANTYDGIIFCWEGYPVHCKMLSSISGPHPQGVSSHPISWK